MRNIRLKILKFKHKKQRSSFRVLSSCINKSRFQPKKFYECIFRTTIMHRASFPMSLGSRGLERKAFQRNFPHFFSNSWQVQWCSQLYLLVNFCIVMGTVLANFPLFIKTFVIANILRIALEVSVIL